MGSELLRAVEHAYDVLASTAQPVHKTIWGSPAGKKRIAARLAGMLPPHKTYVEPFAGSAAVLFAKEPAEVEVINDADAQIARAYKLIQKLKPKDISRLRDKTWVGDEATFKRIFDDSPRDDVGWLHRFLYLTHFSYGKLRGRSFSPPGRGVEAKTVGRIEQFAPRLKGVKVFGGDYRPIVEKYDGKDSALFLDPPYAGYNVNVGEDAFDEAAFCRLLTKLDGKFLLTYGIRGKLPRLVKEAGFEIKRIRTRRTISSMRGVGGPSILTQLIVSNYILAQKSLEGFARDGWDVEETRGATVAVPSCFNVETVDVAKHVAQAFSSTSALLKGIDPDDERFVFGIVLEPEVVDAQGDIYSVDEIRLAAHRFMQEFGGLGLMHRMRVNDQVKVLESYLAPADFELGGVSARKGTWLLGVRVLSDELWSQVKDGSLGGFSIGGTARKYPEPGVPGADESGSEGDEVCA